MALSIRDPRAAKLAKRLASQRGTTMTAAIIQALEAELAREKSKAPLHERLLAIAKEFDEATGPAKRPPMTKKEIDDMWWR